MKWLFLLFPSFCFAIMAAPEALSPLTVSIQTPNPGYSIQIERVDRGEKQVYVLVSVVSPPPGMMYPAVISEASDTVQIAGTAAGPQIYILNRPWGWGDETNVKTSADYLKAIGDAQPVPFQRKK
jgi:hypothetical protein